MKHNPWIATMLLIGAIALFPPLIIGIAAIGTAIYLGMQQALHNAKERRAQRKAKASQPAAEPRARLRVVK